MSLYYYCTKVYTCKCIHDNCNNLGSTHPPTWCNGVASDPYRPLCDHRFPILIAEGGGKGLGCVGLLFRTPREVEWHDLVVVGLMAVRDEDNQINVFTVVLQETTDCSWGKRGREDESSDNERGKLTDGNVGSFFGRIATPTGVMNTESNRS